jgi:hypothetical protein
LQSLYKRLLPVFISNKSQSTKLKLPTDLKEEKNLEEFIDKTLKELIIRLQNSEEKLSSVEKESEKKQEQIIKSQKKHEEHISKLTKIIKEKEIYYTKQNESLVNYYEQLLNDVNSRVKV